jgi:hypothetical protein
MVIKNEKILNVTRTYSAAVGYRTGEISGLLPQ